MSKPKLRLIDGVWFCSRGPKMYTGMGPTPMAAWRMWAEGGAGIYGY